MSADPIISLSDFGTFQFTTFHRGMKNAANCLQYTMDEVLKDIDDIQVYQGQVLVYSSSYEDHLWTLKSIFSAFRFYNLKIDVEESLFMASKLVFLGRSYFGFYLAGYSKDCFY